MSISLASGILRSRVTQLSEPMLHVLRASNWPTVGQYVIQFRWDMWKNMIASGRTCLFRNWWQDPTENLALGTLTHKSPRCLQVGNGFSDVITGCASSILAGCLQNCSSARGLLFELVQSLAFVITRSVCEDHIDDLSQFATSSSGVQLLYDAAQIGKKPRDGTAQL